MNIYLESVNLDEIKNAALAGPADGVAFSHVAFSVDAPDASAKERLEEISREFAFPVCVPVGAVASADMYTEARAHAKVADPIILPLPPVGDSLIPLTKLRAYTAPIRPPAREGARRRIRPGSAPAAARSRAQRHNGSSVAFTRARNTSTGST